MKRVLTLIIVLAFICAGSIIFIGCQKKKAAGGEVVITIPHYKAGQNVGGKFFLPQVARFNEKYAGTYKLVIEEIPQDSYLGKIKQLAQQNKLPALIEGADKKWFEDVIIKNGLFYDMADWLNSHKAVKDRVIQDSLKFVTTADGRVSAFPLMIARPIGLFYNSTMVDFDKPVGDMTVDSFKKALGDEKLALMTAENA